MFTKEIVEATHKEALRFLVKLEAYKALSEKTHGYSKQELTAKRLAAYRSAMDLREALVLLCKRNEVVS